MTNSVKVFFLKSILDFEFEIEFENQIRIHAYERVNTYITSIHVSIHIVFHIVFYKFTSVHVHMITEAKG